MNSIDAKTALKFIKSNKFQNCLMLEKNVHQLSSKDFLVGKKFKIVIKPLQSCQFALI